MEKSPRYRILSFTTSKEGDERQWFSLEIQLHTSRFRISVSPSNFRNSAVRSAEFQKYFSLLLSEHEDHDDFSEEMDEGDGDVPSRTAVHDCFDWAVIPCLADFERLSPAPPPLVGGQLSLSHFLVVNSFECDLNAIDDVLVPGEIERVEMDMDEDCWPSPSSGDAWTTSFPSFSPTEIAVICDDPEKPFDSNPTRVCIGQQQLYFKEAMDLDDIVAKREVEVYERIAEADLGTDVHTSRLYGVVRNERNQLVGLLLYPIEEDAPLTFAVGPETPDALKVRWAKQIQHTVAALHQAGITWGDAKPDNILIDVHGDAWITDFGGGRTEGWVDADKAGTVNGDLQALERILKFIVSGGDDWDKDCSEE
jgi:tRNA A-37 threonylcarbamoyl transferase component Bud32